MKKPTGIAALDHKQQSGSHKRISELQMWSDVFLRPKILAGLRSNSCRCSQHSPFPKVFPKNVSPFPNQGAEIHIWRLARILILERFPNAEAKLYLTVRRGYFLLLLRLSSLQL